MKKNEERIWDVLIEDALQEQPVESAPPGDHTRRLLRPMGPIGVDRGRSMRHGGRRKWVPIAGAAAVLVFVATVLYGGVVWLPKLSEANQTNPEKPRTAEEGQPEQVPQPKQTDPQEEPSGKPTAGPQPIPEPEPAPEPEAPEDSLPEPEPTLPDDRVEQPQPIPEPAPEPVPGPVKPDDAVEEPNRPEETAPASEFKPTITLLSSAKGARLEYAATTEREFAPAGDRSDFPNGVWLACRKPVDLLAGGVLLRLDGEVRVEITGDALVLELDDDDVYVDNRGASLAVNLSVKDHKLSMPSGAVLIENGASGVDVTVFDGEALFGEDVIPAGRRGVIKKRGLAGLYEPRDEMGDAPFLKGLTNRVVYREDFDADPEGRLRAGELADGVITGGKVFWGYPQNIAYEPGLVIRLRVRFMNATATTLTQFCEERNDNYSVDLKDLRQGEWFVLEVRVDDFLERTNHEGHPQVGESFMNVSLQTSGDKAQVELDWVELIRAVK